MSLQPLVAPAHTLLDSQRIESVHWKTNTRLESDISHTTPPTCSSSGTYNTEKATSQTHQLPCSTRPPGNHNLRISHWEPHGFRKYTSRTFSSSVSVSDQAFKLAASTFQLAQTSIATRIIRICGIKSTARACRVWCGLFRESRRESQTLKRYPASPATSLHLQRTTTNGLHGAYLPSTLSNPDGHAMVRTNKRSNSAGQCSLSTQIHTLTRTFCQRCSSQTHSCRIEHTSALPRFKVGLTSPSIKLSDASLGATVTTSTSTI